MREPILLRPLPRTLRRAALFLAPVLLAGCKSAVLDPAGAVALEQRNLIYASTGLMLLIIVPVMILTAVFAWRYRKGNAEATYDPDFHHSTSLELVIWSAPLLIIICLGALTWSSTHLLDPFRPLDKGKAAVTHSKPLNVQVVSLDWKWLFIYPEQGVATVNELVLPVGRQVRFDMTSTNMMNTFYAPTLAGMVYTMPGMTSTLHAILNRPGDYDGMSANYSGAGFSDMHFRLKGVDAAGFDQWLASAKSAGQPLDTARLLQLEKPSQKVPTMRFSSVEADLFARIANRCEKPGATCMGHQPPAGAKPDGALFKSKPEIKPVPNGFHNSHDISFLPTRATARG